jgi:hypothetical protein
MGCFKIVEHKDYESGHVMWREIEIHHEGPIVEKEVKILSKPMSGGNRVETWEIVKLPVCQACGMVVFEEEKKGGPR